MKEYLIVILLLSIGCVNSHSDKFSDENRLLGIYEVTDNSDTSNFIDYWQFEEKQWHELTWTNDGVEHLNKNLEQKITGTWKLLNDTLSVTPKSKRGNVIVNAKFWIFKMKWDKEYLILTVVDDAEAGQPNVQELRLEKR